MMTAMLTKQLQRENQLTSQESNNKHEEKTLLIFSRNRFYIAFLKNEITSSITRSSVF